MSSLENLLAKIQRDGECKAEEIARQAQADAQAIINEQRASGEQQAQKLLQTAQLEAEHAAQQIRMQNQMQIRDSALSAKRELLDRVFEQALARLCSMPADQFEAYLVAALEQADPDGEALYLPKQYQSIDIARINAALKAKGRHGNLLAGVEPEREIEGGFVLSKDGVESNNSFQRLVAYHRSSLESELLRVLL